MPAVRGSFGPSPRIHQGHNIVLCANNVHQAAPLLCPSRLVFVQAPLSVGGLGVLNFHKVQRPAIIRNGVWETAPDGGKVQNGHPQILKNPHEFRVVGVLLGPVNPHGGRRGEARPRGAAVLDVALVRAEPFGNAWAVPECFAALGAIAGVDGALAPPV